MPCVKHIMDILVGLGAIIIGYTFMVATVAGLLLRLPLADEWKDNNLIGKFIIWNAEYDKFERYSAIRKLKQSYKIKRECCLWVGAIWPLAIVFGLFWGIAKFFISVVWPIPKYTMIYFGRLLLFVADTLSGQRNKNKNAIPAAKVVK